MTLEWISGIAFLTSILPVYLSLRRPVEAWFTALASMFLGMWGLYESVKAQDEFYEYIAAIAVGVSVLAILVASLYYTTRVLPRKRYGTIP